MVSERDIELAHPDAFDFVFGNLAAADRADFNRHLGGCRYCQAIIDEYSEIGRIIKNLPPHVEPPTDLEERAVAAMTAALADQRVKADRQPDAEPETQLRPGLQPAPVVTRLAGRRRHRGRLAAVVAAAAAIITAAIVLPLSLGGGGISPAQATVVIPLHVTTAAKQNGYGAATGKATARQGPSGSWNVSLTVAHLKSFGDGQWYQCWYVSRSGQVTSAGTFTVRSSGSWTFPMTSAADPHDFRTMEITIGPPSKTGALTGLVVLSGQPL
jgi:hypothetical protein